MQSLQKHKAVTAQNSRKPYSQNQSSFLNSQLNSQGPFIHPTEENLSLLCSSLSGEIRPANPITILQTCYCDHRKHSHLRCFVEQLDFFFSKFVILKQDLILPSSHNSRFMQKFTPKTKMTSISLPKMIRNLSLATPSANESFEVPGFFSLNTLKNADQFPAFPTPPTLHTHRSLTSGKCFPIHC